MTRKRKTPQKPEEPAAEIIPASYGAVLDEIKQRIREAQLAALRAVNRELVNLYWEIGRLIVERQQGETWQTRPIDTSHI
jgi:hypothetical protein